MARRLRDGFGEHAWLRLLVGRLGRPGGIVRVGPGDDAAVLAVGRTNLLVTTDALVDGVHFRRAWIEPRALGARAFGVNASDVAAMGGRPLAAVMALEVPRGTAPGVLDAIVAGFVAAARRHRTTLVGGNVARAPRLAITVTLLGTPGPRVVTRAGARPGDTVWVTGSLGAMGTAVRARRAGRAVRVPAVPDRVAAAARLATVASAMIDVSDGLAQDLGHVCRASGVTIRLALGHVPVAASCRRALGSGAPAFAATAGEDYELAFTVPAKRRRALERLRPRLGCAITPIGVVERGRPRVIVIDERGRERRLTRPGFDHLR